MSKFLHVKLLLKKFSSFTKDSKGVVAVFFAVMIIPIVALSGAIIDYSAASSARSEIQSAADMAALVAVRALDEDDEELQEIARKVFEDNLENVVLMEEFVLETSRIDGGIRVDVSSSVETSFLRLVGLSSIDISVFSEAIDSTVNVEVVMVLDNTFSMAGSKMDALKDAANLLVDELLANNDDGKIKVGLVPFAQYVNIGKENRNEPGIDVPDDFTKRGPDYCRNTYPNSTRKCDRKKEYYSCVVDGVATTCSRWKYFNCTGDRGDPVWTCTPRIYKFKWHGNMGSRSYPLNVLDEDYDVEEVPALMTRWNTYWATRKLTRLTSDNRTIRRAISKMRTAQSRHYSTYIPVGLIWGWRLLSQEAPFTDAAPYGDGNKKVMVVLTDGANTRSTGIRNSQKHYRWMLNQGALPANEDSWHYGDDVDDANEKTLELCSNIKQKDIVIYTIAFDVDNDEIRDIMQDCSGNGGRYFDADDADQLSEVFAKIAEDLSALRLSK